MARLDYFAPGVYIEEVDRGARPIEGVSTAVAGFVGFTEDVRNGAEVFKPMLVTNWTQYLNYFARPNSDGFTDFNAYLPFAVYGFFLNGGGRCWIASIGTQLPNATKLTTPEPAVVQINGRGNRPSLILTLRPEQAAGGLTSLLVIVRLVPCLKVLKEKHLQIQVSILHFRFVAVRKSWSSMRT
jgi:phage tail sheath protein FI